MKDRKANLIIENGGGNQNMIFIIIDDLYLNRCDDLPWSARNIIWKSLLDLDCDHFYTATNSKITRPLKKILETVLGKNVVAASFAEFCKRVGNLYAQVSATAALRSTYFDDPDAGSWGDDGSCFLQGGCNRIHGQFISASPCTGVIIINPIDDRYAAGRMIVWFKDSCTAHLINKYSRSRGRELPHSVFVRALEQLTDTKLSYHRSDNYTTLPVYLNNTPVICSTLGDTTFENVIESYKFKCSKCGEYYAAGDRPQHLCPDCINEEDERAICEGCDERLDPDDTYFFNDCCYCENCYSDIAFSCDSCCEDYSRDDAVEVVDSRGRNDGIVCSNCAENHYRQCNECDNWAREDDAITTEGGTSYCCRCAKTRTQACEKCGIVSDDLDDFDEDGNCSDCHEETEEEAS